MKLDVIQARREKEQIMWRCKEKLRDSDIVVTEDSQSRLMALMHANAEKIKPIPITILYEALRY